MKTIEQTILVVIFGAFAAITSYGEPIKDIGGEQPRCVSICNIYNKIDNLLGKTVRLHAVYETDGGSYAYFGQKKANEKKPCRGKNVIDIARTPDMKDKTVVAFFKAGKEICKKRGSALCSLTADVDFEAKIAMRGKDPILKLTKVISYRYYVSEN